MLAGQMSQGLVKMIWKQTQVGSRREPAFASKSKFYRRCSTLSFRYQAETFHEPDENLYCQKQCFRYSPENTVFVLTVCGN
jgi:hypothetical protein